MISVYTHMSLSFHRKQRQISLGMHGFSQRFSPTSCHKPFWSRVCAFLPFAQLLMLLDAIHSFSPLALSPLSTVSLSHTLPFSWAFPIWTLPDVQAILYLTSTKQPLLTPHLGVVRFFFSFSIKALIHFSFVLPHPVLMLIFTNCSCSTKLLDLIILILD